MPEGLSLVTVSKRTRGETVSARLVLNLGTDADFDLVTVSRRPQPEK